MSEYIDNLKRTNNGRELEARAQVASVIGVCETKKYAAATAIWGALTLLGELAINVAAVADALEGTDDVD